ncbi:hypothetical protein ABFS83_09G088100 [Erythranthe nasuta]
MSVLSRNYKYHHHHLFLLTLSLSSLFFLSLTKSVGAGGSEEYSRSDEELRKMILGSRPPGCVNKCMNCRPCEAILVIPPHLIFNNNNNYQENSSPHRQEEDHDSYYYLLSWKCRCRNKLYQP